MRGKVLIVLLCLFGATAAWTQEKSDTTDITRVRILHADEVEFEKDREGLTQTLRGNVALVQDSTFFYCDSAIVLNNTVWAKGNIQILQGDSTSIFADSLYYSGDSSRAQLHGEVALLNKDNELYTEALDYDLAEKKASYNRKAYLQRGSTRINSVRGQYWLDSHRAVFADSVVVVDSNFVLKADTLQFDTESRIAYFMGPTAIDQGANRIYCESGYYNFKSRTAEFATNASFRKEDQKGRARKILYDDSTGVITLVGEALITEVDQLVRGDSIIYYQKRSEAEIHGNGFFKDSTRQLEAEKIFYQEENQSLRTEGQASYFDGDIQLDADYLEYDDSTGRGRAIGHVVWQDTLNDLAIFSDELNYNKRTQYVKATGRRPYMAIIVDGDTMFVGGDTLLSEREFIEPMDSTGTKDTVRQIRVYNDVKIYKTDLQGICDSLVYSERDSAFVMMNEPLLWSDTSQFSGDTIKVFLKNKSVDHVFQDKNALIINSNDLVYFNQIQGKEITTFFADGRPDETLVEGNAQSIYFALDEEDAYIAANKSICSRIKIHFRERKIREIIFLTQPKAEMLPMSTPGLESIKLDGFIWKYDLRPERKKDVTNGL